MGYILLSVFIALAELSASFLFVNYLQEIYLFELYKASGFSVNLGYFVSIIIFLIVYFLFSWTFNEIFGKNINYLASQQAEILLSNKKKAHFDSKVINKIYSYKEIKIIENITITQLLISALYIFFAFVFHQHIFLLGVMMVVWIVVFKLIKNIFGSNLHMRVKIVWFLVVLANIFSLLSLALPGSLSIFIKIYLLLSINAFMLFVYTIYKKASK